MMSDEEENVEARQANPLAKSGFTSSGAANK